MCSISKNFLEDFKSFISKRVLEDLADCLSNNGEYVRVTAEIETYADKIKSSASSEHDKEFDLLFDRFDSLCGELETIIADIMYMQGMRDCFKLCSILMLEEKGA